MTIKAQTLEQIYGVFNQKKLYYRTNELPFATSKNGYSNHEGAILRKFLRENGFLRVRISLIDKKWLTQNGIDLKPSNVIIIKEADYVPRNSKIVMEEVIQTTRYILLKKVNFTSTDNYYYIRTTVDGVNKYSWAIGRKNDFGLISFVGGSLSDTKSKELEAEFQQAVKNK